MEVVTVVVKDCVNHLTCEQQELAIMEQRVMRLERQLQQEQHAKANLMADFQHVLDQLTGLRALHTLL